MAQVHLKSRLSVISTSLRSGSYKAEMVYLHGPFKTIEELEWSTLLNVDWFNNRRLHGSLEWIPPAEFERNYYARISLGNNGVPK